MKEVNLKRLHTIGFELSNIVKGQNCGEIKSSVVARDARWKKDE